MKELTSSPSQAELVERTSSVAPSPGAGIRDLLRDTALFVSNLSSGGSATNFDSMHKSCNAMIEAFGAALVRRGYAGDVLHDVTIAQCALLDEVALERLTGADRDNWASQPLQVSRFEQHDAGEVVIDRLEARMRERTPRVDVLEFYAAILGLGFKGRYAVSGEAAREALIAELNARLARVHPADARALLIDQPGRRFGDGLRRLSPWAIAGIGCVVSFVLWLFWHVALDAQLAALAPKVIKP